MKSKLILGALLCSLFIVVGCKQESHPEFKIVELQKPVLGKNGIEGKASAASKEEVAVTTAPGEVDLERGKKIWNSVCIQCHNKDPNIKGSIGPETVDAPEEVMYSKVMTGKYPDVLPSGFVPKRKTKNMRALPQYGPDVPSIWAYVQSVKKSN